MKQVFFLILAAALLITTGCNKDDIDDGPKMQMTMTFHGDWISFGLSGEGKVTIDWGDGSKVENYTFTNPSGLGVRRDYNAASIHTITITGENITDLRCYGSLLTNLDVSKNTALTFLDCGLNRLTNLDVSENIGLVYLSCGANQLTTLDLIRNTELINLECGSNQLINLDISNNAALTTLDCTNNQLTTLDISNNTELIRLYCSKNQLTHLDVSNNSKLTRIDCSDNYLSSIALNLLFASLPNTRGEIMIVRNPGVSDCDRNIALNKGWWTGRF